MIHCLLDICFFLQSLLIPPLHFALGRGFTYQYIFVVSPLHFYVHTSDCLHELLLLTTTRPILAITKAGERKRSKLEVEAVIMIYRFRCLVFLPLLNKSAIRHKTMVGDVIMTLVHVLFYGFPMLTPRWIFIYEFYHFNLWYVTPEVKDIIEILMISDGICDGYYVHLMLLLTVSVECYDCIGAHPHSVPFLCVWLFNQPHEVSTVLVPKNF